MAPNPVPRIMMEIVQKKKKKKVKLREQLEEGTTWEKELFLYLVFKMTNYVIN